MKTINIKDFEGYKKEIILVSDKDSKLIAIYSADDDNIFYQISNKTKRYECDYLTQAIEIYNKLVNGEEIKISL